MIDRIEIISGQDSRYSDKDILDVLQKKRITATHGQSFTGRPVTEIACDDKNLVKIRTEYRFAEREARIFTEQAVEKEKQLGIYSPDKTWFLIFEKDTNNNQNVRIANISPLLKPLHHTDEILKTINKSEYLQLITGCINIYLDVAKSHETGIDLSLSNFAIDKENKIYYVDDDTYRWDDFAFLPHFLASLLRSLDWLDKKLVTLLGERTRALLLEHFADSHLITVIAEEVRSLFVADDKLVLRNCLVDAIYSAKAFNYQAVNKSSLIALLADPHANLEALETCINYLQKRGINDAIVLGDIVGYGPYPEECIELIQAQAGYSVIRGNHDHAVATGKKVSGATSVAGWTLNWTQQKLNDDYKDWLANLPPYLSQDNWLAVHGSPCDKTFFNGYVYQMTYTENLDELANRDIPLCFHGHTHIQKIYYRSKGVDSSTEDETKVIQSAKHALICPGSIGQPRSGKVGVEFAVIDLNTLEMEFHRLPYNLDKTITAMQKNKFPGALCERLLEGK